DGTSIYVRTSRGSKLDAAMRGMVVAFEVDEVDVFEHTGWSVVVTGVAHEVTDADELERLSHAPIARWADGWDGHVMSITTELVSGRRLGALHRSPTVPGNAHRPRLHRSHDRARQ